MEDVNFSDESRRRFIQLCWILFVSVIFLVAAVVVYDVSPYKRSPLSNIAIKTLFVAFFVTLLASIPGIRKFNASIRRDKRAAKPGSQ